MSSIASPSHPQSPSSLFSPKSLSSINFQSSSAPTGCPGIKLTRRSSFKTSSLVLFTFILSFSLIGRTSGQSVLTQLLAPRIQNLLDSVLPERTPMIPTGGIMHPSRVKERMRRPPNNPGALPFSSSLSMTRVRRPSHAHHHIPQSLSPFHPNSGSGRGPMFLRGVEPPSFSSSGPLNLFPAESVSFLSFFFLMPHKLSRKTSAQHFQKPHLFIHTLNISSFLSPFLSLQARLYVRCSFL